MRLPAVSLCLGLMIGSVALRGAEEPAIRPASDVFAGQPGHTIAGDVRIIDGFAMPQFGETPARTRRIWVYLPPGYATGGKHYPVLYMQDGQNVFDAKTSFVGEWRVDETLERLFAEHKSAGTIVVAVENGREKRGEEYVAPFWGMVDHPRGDKYAQFLVETLKPYIDAHFRTRPERESTAIASSSGGALISFHVGMEYPRVFSRIGAFSFTLPDDAASRIEAWCAAHPKRAGMRIYLHIGTDENISQRYPAEMWVRNLTRLHDALRRQGYDESELRLDVQTGGHHNEVTWADRFEQAVLWLGRP